MRRFVIIAILLGAFTFPAGAVNPSEMLKDPVLELRAREISKHLRCVVCQNQSIDDSDATLARDLRVLVRDRLMTGASDTEVIDYVVSRYGDFVLLKPPFKLATMVLWFGPGLILLLALLAMVNFYRRQQRTARAATPPPLSDDERQRFDDLMKDDAP